VKSERGKGIAKRKMAKLIGGSSPRNIGSGISSMAVTNVKKSWSARVITMPPLKEIFVDVLAVIIE
jgi:hypothetical protein